MNKNGVGFRANHAKAATDLALWMTRGYYDGQMRRRVGGFTTYNGEVVSRVWLACEIAGWYSEQLTHIANGDGVNAHGPVFGSEAWTWGEDKTPPASLTSERVSFANETPGCDEAVREYIRSDRAARYIEG